MMVVTNNLILISLMYTFVKFFLNKSFFVGNMATLFWDLIFFLIDICLFFTIFYFYLTKKNIFKAIIIIKAYITLRYVTFMLCLPILLSLVQSCILFYNLQK